MNLPLVLKEGEGGPTTTLARSPTPSPSAGDRTIGSSTVVAFPVYTEWVALDNHFIPSGWMGDWESIDLYECERVNPHSGELAIWVTYAATGTLVWAGIYWQEPENNWGALSEGYDLTGATALTFWARGEEGGEKVEFKVGGLGVCGDEYPDSLRPALSTGVITLSREWQKHEIDLRGQDLSHVIGGFAWVANRCSNPNGITFYLDDVVYEFDPNPPPTPTPTPIGPTFPVYTDHDALDNHFAPSGWMGATQDISLLECATEEVHSGSTSIKVSYSPTRAPRWAGVFWQYPSENWADRPGGYDLTGARRVTFWAKSTVPGMRVKFFVGGIGYVAGTCTRQSTVMCSEFLDSICPMIEVTHVLSDTWQKYEIPIPSDRDLSNVVGGFGWVTNEPATFYLDDVMWEFDD